MKKIFWVLMVMVLVLVILLLGSRVDEDQSPSVVKAINTPVVTISDEDNIYIGLLGLGYVQYGDVATAGRKLIKDGYPPSDGAEPAPTDELKYLNPCAHPEGDGCLDQILIDADVIEAALKSNQEVLERYGQVRKMPRFVDVTSGPLDPIPQYQYVIGSVRLLSSKALLDIKRGEVAAGLKAIEEDLEFLKKMNQGERVGLITMMVANAGLATELMSLSRVIEDESIDLSGHEDQLRKMLELDFDAVQMMTAALELEKEMLVKTFDEAIIKDFDAESNFFKKQMFKHVLKRNMTINRMADFYDRTIAQMKAAPLIGFPEFLNRQSAELEKARPAGDSLSVKKLYDEYGPFFFKNYAGEVLLQVAQPEYIRYLARINNLNVQARLVRAQLELRLMPNRPEDISAALAGLGPEYRNPYTDKPFEWNKEKGRIGADRAASSGQGQDGLRVEVNVPKARP